MENWTGSQGVGCQAWRVAYCFSQHSSRAPPAVPLPSSPHLRIGNKYYAVLCGGLVGLHAGPARLHGAGGCIDACLQVGARGVSHVAVDLRMIVRQQRRRRNVLCVEQAVLRCVRQSTDHSLRVAHRAQMMHGGTEQSPSPTHQPPTHPALELRHVSALHAGQGARRAGAIREEHDAQ